MNPKDASAVGIFPPFVCAQYQFIGSESDRANTLTDDAEIDSNDNINDIVFLITISDSFLTLIILYSEVGNNFEYYSRF